MSGPQLHITLSKLNPQRHRIDIFRSDASIDGAELETRGFLLHDLMHFAIERALGLPHGFYGLLATGHDLMEVRQPELLSDSDRSALLNADTFVEPMLSVWQRQISVMDYVTQLSAPGLDADFVSHIQNHVRSLLDTWRHLPYGEGMCLLWEPPEI